MDELVIAFIKAFLVFNVAQGLASYCVWVERKGSALIQDRIGANRAGAYFYSQNPILNFLLFPVRLLGVLGVINTLVCDAVKALLKEDFVPEGTSNFMHSLAPFLAVFPVFVAFAMTPIAPDFSITLFGHEYLIRPQVASLDSGILVIFAMAGISVYGVVLAGWCSNNKFSMLGSLRASAQMISYELALGLAIAAMIIYYSTVDIYEMVIGQQHLIAGVLPAWGIFVQPLAFILFFAAGMAETKRTPFDLPESESELVAGYFTEYSGMKFLLFWLGEFAEIALFALIMALLFFGGWDIPGVALPKVWWGALIGHAVLMTKVILLCTLQIVIRWTLPRFRFDQLMNLGWKILLPASLANLALVAWLKLAL